MRRFLALSIRCKPRRDCMCGGYGYDFASGAIIPPKDTAQNNSESVLKYRGNLVGDINPSLPDPPAGDDGCSGGQILMMVVAIAVTVWTAGAGASSIASAFGVSAAEGTALNFAIAAGVGDLAGQVAGNIVGAHQGIDLGEAAISAAGAFIGASIFPNPVAQGDYLGMAARGATNSVVSQGLNVITGRQDSFNWKGVVASAIAAPIANGLVNGAVGALPNGTSPLVRDFVAGATSSIVRQGVYSAVTGGRMSLDQIAVDAFSNAIGQSIAGKIIKGASQQTGNLQSSWDDINDAGSDVSDINDIFNNSERFVSNEAKMSIGANGSRMLGDSAYLNTQDDEPTDLDDIKREIYLLNARTHATSSYSPSGVVNENGKDYYLTMRDENGLGIYQNVDFNNSQSRNGLVVATPPQVVRANASPVNQRWNEAKEYLVNAAVEADVDAGILAKIAAFESGFRSDARPIARDASRNTVRQFDGVMAISSAFGFGQFTDATWADTIRKYGSDYGISNAGTFTTNQATAYRNDVGMQAAMLAEFTKANVDRGRALGAENDDANVYALHNLGSGDGPRFLKAMANNPNASVNSVLSSAVIRGNGSLYGDGSLSLRDAYNRMGIVMARGNAFADEARTMQAKGYR